VGFIEKEHLRIVQAHAAPKAHPLLPTAGKPPRVSICSGPGAAAGHFPKPKKGGSAPGGPGMAGMAQGAGNDQLDPGR